MPSIVNPSSRFPSHRAASDDRLARSDRAWSPSIAVRIRTAAQRGDLTRALAQGADAGVRAELTLRAAQLTSRRNRKAIAGALRRALIEAHNPPLARSRVVIIQRAAVLDAQVAVDALIARLVGPTPVRPQGMAIAEELLTNAGGSSPFYNPAPRGALLRAIGDAARTLEPVPRQSHEFPLALP
jgi:hypothetical protein